MTENKKRKPGFEDSPDKCQYVLTKQLDICAKCNKQCVEDDDAIQCRMVASFGRSPHPLFNDCGTVVIKLLTVLLKVNSVFYVTVVLRVFLLALKGTGAL